MVTTPLTNNTQPPCPPPYSPTSPSQFISDDSFPDNKAYLCIATGKVLHKSKEFPSDPDLPKNSQELLNESLYLKVPTKRDLDIGVHEALQFIATSLPEEYDYLEGCFLRRGGWSQFKILSNSLS